MTTKQKADIVGKQYDLCEAYGKLAEARLALSRAVEDAFPGIAFDAQEWEERDAFESIVSALEAEADREPEPDPVYCPLCGVQAEPEQDECDCGASYTEATC